MARQGLAALTGGVMEGYEYVDERKKAKQVRELLGRENVRLKNKAIAEGEDVKRLGGDEFDFETYTPPITFGQKLVRGIKGMFAGQQQAIQPQQAPASPQSVPGQLQSESATTYALPPQNTQPQPLQQFAHGGATRHMRKKYKDGGKVEKEPDPEGAWERFKAGFFPQAREEYRRAGREQAREWEDVTAPGISTAERGRQAREYAGAGIRGALSIPAAALEDTGIPRAISATGEFIGGVLGYGLDDDQTAAVRAIPKDKEGPEQVAGEVGPPTARAGQPARAALPAPAPNVQDAGEDEVDFSTAAREVMPEDLPAHSSKDWEDERNYWAASAIMKGQDPFEAMKKVDQQQLDGFSRYAMQAVALQRGDDMEGAARSLYAAYQYFPNGKNVKFGIQQGKDGRRVIVAMGSDEKTGEPSGPPQVVDANTISRMVENMQKPGALRAWTTDWQNTEGKLWEQGFKQDTLKETGRHNRAMEAVGFAKATATRKGGGKTESNRLAASRDFRGSMEMFGLGGQEEDNRAKVLTAIMGQLYAANYKNGEPNTIINDVWQQHQAGNLIQWLESLGIDVDTE